MNCEPQMQMHCGAGLLGLWMQSDRISISRRLSLCRTFWKKGLITRRPERISVIRSSGPDEISESSATWPRACFFACCLSYESYVVQVQASVARPPPTPCHPFFTFQHTAHHRPINYRLVPRAFHLPKKHCDQTDQSQVAFLVWRSGVQRPLGLN